MSDHRADPASTGPTPDRTGGRRPVDDATAGRVDGPAAAVPRDDGHPCGREART